MMPQLELASRGLGSFVTRVESAEEKRGGEKRALFDVEIHRQEQSSLIVP